MKEYKEGIYFGMPDEEYHAIPYFSRSFSEEMNFDREEAWYKSALNPDKPEQEPTEAMRLGTAIHYMLLEPNIFAKKYVQYPSYTDFKGFTILKDVKDLKSFLKKHGETKLSSLVKKELIALAERYLEFDNHVIWDSVIEDFEIEAKMEGKITLKKDTIEILDGVKESLEIRPEIKKQLTGGYPEVVIIWEDNLLGLKCKSRLDYIKLDSIIDVKSFSVKNKKKPLVEYLENEIRYQNYNLQSSMYRRGLETIIQKIRNKEAKVFGEVNKEWFDKFLENESKQYFVIFARTQPPYQIKEMVLIKKNKKISENLCYTQGIELLMRAARDFIRCQEEFKEKRWLDNKIISPRDEIFQYQIQL